MLLDRSQRNWALFSLISLTVATIGWTVSLQSSPAGPSGGSFSGLIFGIIGTAMMLFAGLLAGRRTLRHLPLGSARFWMKGHLWLGTLCIPFILFHASFSWGGLLEQALWYCLAFVALSGFFGLAVQQFLPGLLWKSVPLETFEPQAPWLCDRLTFLSDARLSAICERQLNAPSPHLHTSAARTVDAYHRLMNGEGARGEKNARKLLLLQEVSPPAVREFFWAMAKFSKSELKAIGFEGDFPEFLARIYSELPQAAPEPSPTATSSGSTMPPVTTPRTNPATPAANLGRLPAPPSAPVAESATSPAVASPTPPAVASPTTAAVKLSPIEIMRQKAAEKAAAAAAASATVAAPNTLPSDPVAESATPPAFASPATPAFASPKTAAVKLSPIEIMRQKAAEKAAAAAAANATVAAPTALPSEPVAESGTPVASAARPASVIPVRPPAALSAGSKQPPPEPPQKKSASQDEKRVLWDFYVKRVRPYLMEQGSGGAVRVSEFGSEIESHRVFHEQECLLPRMLHEVLQELRQAVEVRRQLERQRRILRWMHWWLMLHVPVSVLLLVFLAAHVLMALRVIPWQF